MGKWFEWLAGVDLLVIAYLLEIVDWKIKGLLYIRHPFHIFLLIASILLATGLSIVAYMDYKDARRTKRQKKTLGTTFSLIVYTLVIFVLVYISWFIAKFILLKIIGIENIYPQSALILVLAILIISPFMFCSDKIKKGLSFLFNKKPT